MGYLNEFPHVEANKLNLDWLLEQYSTFNKRIAEILQHFDETVEQIRQDFTETVNSFETSLENFETSINSQFDEFKTEVRTESQTVERVLETITNNMTEYVGDHMSEWQFDNMFKDITISDHIGTVNINVDTSEKYLVIDNVTTTTTVEGMTLMNYIPLDFVTVTIESDKYIVGVNTEFASGVVKLIYHLV